MRQICVFVLLMLAFSLRIEAASDMHALLKQRLEHLKSAPDDKVAIRDVANAYLLIGDYDSAAEYAARLIQIAEQNSDRDFAGLNGAMINIQVLMARGDNENTYRTLEYARVIAQSIEDHKALAMIHNGFILYYSTLVKDTYAAIGHCYQGLEEARLAGDDYRAAIILCNLAELYNDRNDSEGLDYALQAYELAKKLDDEIPLFYTANTLADAYMIQGQLNDAAEILKEAEACAAKLGYTRSVELVLVQAMYAYRYGDVEKALRLCEHAFNCDFYDPSRSVIMRTYLTYAKILNEIGHPAKALEIAQEGIAYADGFRLTSYVGDLMKEIAESNRQLGNHSKALEYFTRYASFMDSTYRVSRERALMEDHIKYEIDEQDRRIRENERELKASRLRTWILIGILIILVGFVFVVLTHYYRKKRLYRAIVRQNGEYLAREQLLLEQIEKSKIEKTSIPKTSKPLSGEKADDIMSRFTLLMTEEKLFKDPNLTVSSVADKLGSNRTYVSRAINESGKTFTQIVNDYRIREAIALISDIEAAIPLKQICGDVGFSSISTFYSTFQSVTGMTPARYRTQLKEMSK